MGMLRKRTPFRYVWGFLDLGSPVPRSADDAFFHSEEAWPDDIFPPYPRGVLRVLSMDVVHLLAAAAKRWPQPAVRGDDPSLGVYLRQVVLQTSQFLQLDDRGAATHFAMEPTCEVEGAYYALKPTTWVVHHVSAKTIRCMFQADIDAGYYRLLPDDAIDISPPAAAYPSLCRCVDRHADGRRRGV